MTPAASSLRFRSLGSGSGGNATLVEARGADGVVSRAMVDCGFTLKDLLLRLAAAGLAPEDIDALFITHEHGDHVGCALSLARRHGVPLWMSRGTWRAIGAPAPGDGARLQFARDGDRIDVGALQLRPFTVPHDAAEPLQLQFNCGALRLGVLTDAGSITDHLLEHLGRCDALLLECNHDRGLLAASGYPASLKARIAGRHGHLSNDTAAEILSRCLHDGLRHVVAAHLSAQNNQPRLAREALSRVCADRPQLQLHVAAQADGFDWIELDSRVALGV